MRGCASRNELFAGTVGSRSQCRRYCDENVNCASFEWWGEENIHPSFGPNYCQVSTTCTYEFSTITRVKHQSILYVKG